MPEVTITISDDEIPDLARQDAATMFRIARRAHGALPRPIQQGDRVRLDSDVLGTKVGVVVCAHRIDAWVWWGDDAHCTYRLSSLVRVEDTPSGLVVDGYEIDPADVR